MQRTKRQSDRLTRKPRLVLMCAGCGRVRSSDRTWRRVKSLPVSNDRVDVSHGICPVCFAAYYPEY